MKRSSDRSGNAAVQGFQLGQRLDGVRIADYARDLPSARGVRGLALRAGLGLRHGLGRNQVRNRVDVSRLDGHFMADGELRNQRAVAAHFGHDEAASLIAGFQSFAELHNVACLHFVLRTGPIPTMCESLHVTSDASTTVCREAA